MILCKAIRILSVILNEVKNLTVLAEILPVGQNDKSEINHYTFFISHALIVLTLR